MKKKSLKTGDDNELKMIFLVLALMILFLSEIYLFINYSAMFVAIAPVALCMLFLTYHLFRIRNIYKKTEELESIEQYENIFKSEKASYLLMRKNFVDLNEKMDHFLEESRVPVDEVIEAEKTIAKIMMNRQKENTAALISATDQLSSQMEEFDKKLKSLDYNFGERQKSVHIETVQEMVNKQQELMSVVREVELSINNELLRLINNMTVQLQGRRSGPEMIGDIDTLHLPSLAEEFYGKTETEDVLLDTVSKIEQEIAETEKKEEDLDMRMIEESHLAPELLDESVKESIVEKNSEPEIQEEPILATETLADSIDDSLIITEQDLEKILLAEMEAEVEMEPVAEPVSIVEPEPVTEPEPIVEPEPVTEPIVEPEPVVEPEPEVPPMPDLSNPNKIMTPDEIAALLANMQ